jgi:hypothetical protein
LTANRFYEFDQISETVREDVADDCRINGRVAMNQHVTESDRGSERTAHGRVDATGFDQQREQLVVGRRLAQPIVSDDVRRYVQRRLYRDLKRMFDEPELLDVAFDVRRSREPAQLGDAGLDECELLLDKLAVGNGVTGRR